MLSIAKGNVDPYDWYSDGDGSDPISVAVDVDESGAPATVETNVVAAHLVATQYSYSGIVLTPVSEDAGVDFQISKTDALSGFADSISIADMDALAADQSVPIWIKANVANAGEVTTGIFESCNIEIAKRESPV